MEDDTKLLWPDALLDVELFGSFSSYKYNIFVEISPEELYKLSITPVRRIQLYAHGMDISEKKYKENMMAWAKCIIGYHDDNK